jgi:predicted helicase
LLQVGVATLNGRHYRFSKSFEESKDVTSSFREFVNGYELSYLSDLVKVSIEVERKVILRLLLEALSLHLSTPLDLK